MGRVAVMKLSCMDEEHVISVMCYHMSSGNNLRQTQNGTHTLNIGALVVT